MKNLERYAERLAEFYKRFYLDEILPQWDAERGELASIAALRMPRAPDGVFALEHVIPIGSRLMADELQEIFQSIDEEVTIADIGCAIGTQDYLYAYKLSQNIPGERYKIVGIDIIDELIVRSRSIGPFVLHANGNPNYVRPRFVTANIFSAQEQGYLQDPWNCAIVGGVIENYGDDKAQEFLGQVAQRLKPGGYLLLSQRDDVDEFKEEISKRKRLGTINKFCFRLEYHLPLSKETKSRIYDAILYDDVEFYPRDTEELGRCIERAGFSLDRERREETSAGTFVLLTARYQGN